MAGDVVSALDLAAIEARLKVEKHSLLAVGFLSPPTAASNEIPVLIGDLPSVAAFRAAQDLRACIGRIHALGAIIEGRDVAPTDAEIDAHAVTGGTWRSLVANEWAFGGDAMNAREARELRDVQTVNAPTNARWWALDAKWAPCPWPVTT